MVQPLVQVAERQSGARLRVLWTAESESCVSPNSHQQTTCFNTAGNLRCQVKQRPLRTLLGGQRQLHPPAGFYESLGIPAESSNPEHSSLRTLLCPEAEIILKSDPKSPSIQMPVQPNQQCDLLENLVPSFAGLINSTGTTVLADARAKVPLKKRQFLD